MRKGNFDAVCIDMADRAMAKLALVRCFCRKEELFERLARRGAKRDEWKLQHFEEFLLNEPMLSAIPIPHLDVGTEADGEKVLRIVLDYVTYGSIPSHGCVCAPSR
jgi:hypothetical protein